VSAPLIPTEIREVPGAIQATVEKTRPVARQAASDVRARNPRRVFITGNGTSYYTSLAASYAARQFALPDDPFVFAMMAGDLRYYTPALSADDVIVGVSASGEFRDVLALFERLEGKCTRIGITHVPGSSITELADFTLVSQGGDSQVPVMTKTYASTLTAIYLFVLELLQTSDEVFDDLAASAERAESAIQAAERLVPEILPDVSHLEHAFYFGAGSGYAAALEGALKMKEMALLHAEGSETWEMASGPATMVSEETLCVAMYTGDEAGDNATADGAQHAKEWGAKVIEVGPNARVGDAHLPMEAPIAPAFAALSLVPPCAYLADSIARARDLNPDKPHWRERYRSQGMTHIIGDE
jgi:glucosamine--fructose-6-phosphate aminotransferase (isomerizing)